MSDEIWDEELDNSATSTKSYVSHNSNYGHKNNGWFDERRDAYNKSKNYSKSSEDRYSKSHDKPRDGRWQNSSREYGNYKSDRTRYSTEESCEISIDNNLVGRVIGRGGSKIQELESESGARIKVLRNDDGLAETSVRITGSEESRNKAKSLIEELTSDFSNLSTSRQDARADSYQSYGQSNNEFTGVIDWSSINKKWEEDQRKKFENLPPIIKDFYNEDPEIAALSTTEVEEFRRKNNSISVMKVDSDDNRKIPNPVLSFKHAFQHYPELLDELRKQGFSTPSPIQSQAWPIIMKGYDLIGIAQTGTGKTIAFLFPALIHLVGQVTPREQRTGPSVLILAPTRELAQQIEVEAKKYTYKGITSICIYGGGSRRDQIKVVTKGVDIVIATPGRLNDLVMNKIIDVTGVTYLVLDEADRMLDMGFEPQIRKIVLDIRSDRQTIMTSATWTIEIQELAARYMIKPMKVNVGAFDLAAVHTVTQEIIFGEDDYDERRRLLNEFIADMGPEDKAIVFVDKKCVADDISSDLILHGTEVQSIHGDREQCDREQALDDLKTGYVKILIATDVASRGLDIKDITLILNLYFPRNIEEYVHRVGRTGRAGRTGRSITVFTRKDWMHAEGLIKILEEANQYVPDELYRMADRYREWKKKKVAEDIAAGGRPRRGGRRNF